MNWFCKMIEWSFDNTHDLINDNDILDLIFGLIFVFGFCILGILLLPFAIIGHLFKK